MIWLEIGDQFQNKLTHSLITSLIFLLKVNSVSSELTIKLLNIVFEFCIIIENSLDTSVQKELYSVSNDRFANYLVFLIDRSNLEELNTLQMILLINYLRFLQSLLNNKNLSNRLVLIPILINILQLAKSNMEFYQFVNKKDELNLRLAGRFLFY